MLAIIRSGGSVEVYNLLQKHKEEVWRRLSTGPSTLEELLLVKGQSILINKMLSDIQRNDKREK